MLTVFICLASAWPDFVLNRIAYPLTHSLFGACGVALGIQILLAMWLGHVGGRANDWRMTSFGIFAMAVGPYFGRFLSNHWMGVYPTASLKVDLKSLLSFAFYLALSAFFASVFHLMTANRQRLIRKGFCRKCNYDLTGNVSGKCPECGTPVNQIEDEAAERGE